MPKYLHVFLLLSSFFTYSLCKEPARDYLEWSKLEKIPPVGTQRDTLGVAGPFVGVHNDALIIAGGANFKKPYWQSSKIWHDDIWVLLRTEKGPRWIKGGKLDRPIAYGACVSTKYGIVCMGGNNANQTFSDVFLLCWNPENKIVEKVSLPDLPTTCAFASATMIGETIYWLVVMRERNYNQP
jgi:hypothetical protein